MTILIVGWIVAMWLIVMCGSLTNNEEGVVGLQFITMLAGVLLIGGAGMLNML
jgi:hypothetical protein